MLCLVETLEHQNQVGRDIVGSFNNMLFIEEVVHDGPCNCKLSLRDVLCFYHSLNDFNCFHLVHSGEEFVVELVCQLLLNVSKGS